MPIQKPKSTPIDLTVAVGTPWPGAPRTDPYVQYSRIRLLSWMSGVKARVGIGMQSAW
jgi:hypothetical protein